MASARLTALCALALLAASAFAVRLEVRAFSCQLCGPAKRAAQNAPFFRDVENDVRLDAPTVSLSFNGTLTSAAADSAAAVRRSARVTFAAGPPFMGVHGRWSPPWTRSPIRRWARLRRRTSLRSSTARPRRTERRWPRRAAHRGDFLAERACGQARLEAKHGGINRNKHPRQWIKANVRAWRRLRAGQPTNRRLACRRSRAPRPSSSVAAGPAPLSMLADW